MGCSSSTGTKGEGRTTNNPTPNSNPYGNKHATDRNANNNGTGGGPNQMGNSAHAVTEPDFGLGFDERGKSANPLDNYHTHHSGSNGAGDEKAPFAPTPVNPSAKQKPNPVTNKNPHQNRHNGGGDDTPTAGTLQKNGTHLSLYSEMSSTPRKNGKKGSKKKGGSKKAPTGDADAATEHLVAENTSFDCRSFDTVPAGSSEAFGGNSAPTNGAAAIPIGHALPSAMKKKNGASRDNSSPPQISTTKSVTMQEASFHTPSQMYSFDTTLNDTLTKHQQSPEQALEENNFFKDDDDDADMHSVEDYPEDDYDDGDGERDKDDLAQTVTIFSAGIEPDVLAVMLREGGEFVHHRSSSSKRSASGTPYGGTLNDLGTDGDEEGEEYEEYEETETGSSYTETVSVASDHSNDDEELNAEDDDLTNFRANTTGHLSASPSAAKYRLVKRGHHQRTNSMLPPPTLDGVATSPSVVSSKFRNIEESCEPDSAAGMLINQRIHQIGRFDLTRLRPGADLLSGSPKKTPPLATYDPAKDPRVETGEYEKKAQECQQLNPGMSYISPASPTNSVNKRTMNASIAGGQFGSVSNGAGTRDYGRGASNTVCGDISSSWDLLRSIPNAVETLNNGGILFRYQAKKWKDMTLSEKIEMGSFVNLSQYADEEAENDQPIIDFVNNTFSNPEDDLTEMLVICARLVMIVPKVDSKDMNIDMLTSNDYQKILLASDEVLEKADRPRTFRKNKTVIKFVFSFRVQMSGSERADEEEMAKHVHHHDCKPNRLLIMERTRKNRGPRDGTLKSKACTLYYDIPPAGFNPKEVALGAPAKDYGHPTGGVLASSTNITIKSSIPSGMLVLMDRIGASIGSDCVRNLPNERAFLVTKKEQLWELMSAGGDFPELNVPWKM